jgi:hypothetical protein
MSAWLIALSREEWAKPAPERPSLVELVKDLPGVEVREDTPRAIAVVCDNERALARVTKAVDGVATVSRYKALDLLVDAK